MVFKINLIKKNPKPIYILCILVFFIILFSQELHAIGKSKLKKIYQDYNGIMGVTFYKNKNLYTTFSAFTGVDKELFEPKEEVMRLLHAYQDKKISLTISTYKEFLPHVSSVTNQVKLLNQLPNQINKYLEILETPSFKLIINYVLIYEKSIFHETQKQSISDDIKLTFFESLNEKQVQNFSNIEETSSYETFAHEFFHFLTGYSRYQIKNELREELYANIFGKCLVYDVTKQVPINLDLLKFSDLYFRNPAEDLKKMRKEIKKMKFNQRKLIKSRVASILALYYFQAVADNHTGENIHSDNIPKFCHKLFSEHNFKYPIEKKPPPWFKGFLEDNR